MAITVRLPQFLPNLFSGVIRCVHVREGDELLPGAALADLFVDLSAGHAYDCPPTAFYRLTLGEGGRMSRVDMRDGQEIAVNEMLGLLEPERGGGDTERDARVMVASILFHDDWWDDEAGPG